MSYKFKNNKTKLIYIAVAFTGFIIISELMQWATNWRNLQFSQAIVVILVIALATGFWTEQLAKWFSTIK